MAPYESNNTNCYYCSYIAALIASCMHSFVTKTDVPVDSGTFLVHDGNVGQMPFLMPSLVSM